jgi:hypothetical protein
MERSALFAMAVSDGGKWGQFAFGTVKALVSFCDFDIENSLVDLILGC